MRIPPFWRNDPETWFTQIEAQFGTHEIPSQETELDYVVGNIVAEIVSEMMDIIRNPPEVDPYNHLKTAIIDRTTVSERGKFQQLRS